MWLAIAGIWVISGDIGKEIVTFVSTCISITVAVYANFTFYLAKKKIEERD